MKKYLITFLICNLTLMSSWVYAVEFKIRGMMGQTENVQEKQIYSEVSSWSFFIDYFGVSHDSYIVRGFKNNLNDFDSKIISNQILFSIGNPINITLGKSIQTNGKAFSKVDFNSEDVSQTQFYSNSSENLKDKGLFFNTFSVSFRGENFEIILAKNIFKVKFTNFDCRFGNCNNFSESDYKKGMSVEMNMFGIGFIF